MILNLNRSPSMMRYVLLLVGVGLCIWALSDDYLIGGGPGFGIVQAVILVAGGGAILAAFLSSEIVLMVCVMYGAFFVAIVGAELILRATVSPRFVTAFELNDDFLYQLKPGVTREYTHLPANGGSRHTYHVNSDGYRGRELHEEQGKRIVVYGDSFIHSEYSTLENTFTERLEYWLSQQGFTGHVVNAGVAGFGPDQIALRMEQELTTLNPDLVIVSVYAGNDFGDLTRNKLFKLAPSGKLVRNHPNLSTDIVLQANLSEKEPLTRRIIRDLRKRFGKPPGQNDVKSRMQAALKQQTREYQEYVLQGNNIVDELRSDPYSADISLLANDDGGRYKVQLMAGVLTRIKKLMEDLQRPLALVIVPHPVDVLNGTHSSGVVDKDRWPDYSAERLTESVSNICRKLNLPCLSLLPTMRSEGGASLYLAGGDDHWNNAGQDVAAQAMATFLMEHKIVPGVNITFVK